jgi:hypothetical protein
MVGLVIIAYVKSGFAMKAGSVEQEISFVCFHEQDPIPADDDPYQSKPTVVSDDLINHIFYNNNEKMEFYRNGLVDANGKPRKDDIKKIGNFVIDYDFRLGYGDKGVVYLAQHVPTRIFVAVKSVWLFNEPIDYPDVLSLLKLKRLYGLFKICNVTKREETLIFMPLANGIPSTLLSCSQTFPVKANIENNFLNFDNLEIGLNLINSFIKELEYFAKCGYLQLDMQPGQVYICNDFQSICIIDYDGEQQDQSISENEYYINPLLWSIINLLGIHEYGIFHNLFDWDPLPVSIDKMSQIKNLPHVIDFVRAIDCYKKTGYTLAQLKLDFETLKMNCNKN